MLYVRTVLLLGSLLVHQKNEKEKKKKQSTQPKGLLWKYGSQMPDRELACNIDFAEVSACGSVGALANYGVEVFGLLSPGGMFVFPSASVARGRIQRALLLFSICRRRCFYVCPACVYSCVFVCSRRACKGLLWVFESLDFN